MSNPQFDAYLLVRVQFEALRLLERWAALPCECPRTQNASGDRECTHCKARRFLARAGQGE